MARRRIVRVEDSNAMPNAKQMHGLSPLHPVGSVGHRCCGPLLLVRFRYTGMFNANSRTKVSAASILLCELRLESVCQFLLPLRHPLMPLQLPLYPFSRPQNLTLQIETPALLRIVHVEQPLKPLRNSFYFDVPHLARPNVLDLAGFVHGDVRGREAATAPSAILAGGCEFLRGGGLTVGFGDCAAYYPGAREDDLCYYAVGLGMLDGVV